MRNPERTYLARFIITLATVTIAAALLGNARAQEPDRGVQQLAFYLASESNGTITDCPNLTTWGYMSCFRLSYHSQHLAKLTMELALSQPHSPHTWFGPWAEDGDMIFRFIDDDEEFVVILAEVNRDVFVVVSRIP